MNNIILHIPHSSVNIPFYDGYLQSNEHLQSEINLLTDWYTDELFNLPYKQIITPFSRLFCDVERFSDDSKEVMSKFGMGMCYTHNDNGELMRTVSPDLKLRIKTEFYDQHHKLLENACLDALESHKKVLVIDCHSFPDQPHKRDLNQNIPRPDFCIGTDGFHTPRELVASSITFLNYKGYHVLENDPYIGTMIPMKYYYKDKNVHGIMIEVNRKLYMSDSNRKVEKTSNFAEIRKIIAELISLLSSTQ